MRLRVAGSGPLVVKVAGLVGGVGLYHEETAAAAAAGFQVAALDTSGDRADDPAPGPLSWDFLAGEVVQALDELRARRALLWGTSFGSLVCLAAAARYPKRISGLLLCFPPAPGWRPEVYLALLRWSTSRRQHARATARLFNVGFLTLNAWEFLIPTALLRLPGLARAAADAATPAPTLEQKLQLMWHDDPGMPPRQPYVPSSIIASRLDLVAPFSGARRLAAELPQSRLRVLRLSGHAGAYSHPRTYADWAIAELRSMAVSQSASGDRR